MADENENFLSSVKIGGNEYEIYAKSALSAGWVPASAVSGTIAESSISFVPESAIKKVSESAITSVNQSAISGIGWSAISGLSADSESSATSGIWTPSATREYVTNYVAGRISNVYKFQGSVSTADLPSNPENGDVYNLLDNGTINPTDATHSANVAVGDNVAWVSGDGGWWDKLASVDTNSKMDITAFEAWTASTASTFAGSAASANTAWFALKISGSSETADGQDIINSAKSGAAASAWIESFTGGAAIVNVDSAYLSGDGSTGRPIGLKTLESSIVTGNTESSALVNAGGISSFVDSNYIAKTDITVNTTAHQLVINNTNT